MSQAKELTKQEKVASVPGLLEKIARCQPRIVCFIGLDMSTIVRNRAVGGTGPQKPGLMEFKLTYPEPQAGVKETLFWAVPSTSGLVAGYSQDKLTGYFEQVKKLLDDVKQGSADTAHFTVVQLPLPPLD
ncbi:uracil DNA N-glycosylase Thp1 [Paramarasmius palmivorus]|uniref:Uracil DNA N-glycosylase Thp1 n=1 Tax=Paramarasmius palmivorus TaxID=297713 RepID=A0AAW0CDK0_9AGAR